MNRFSLLLFLIISLLLSFSCKKEHKNAAYNLEPIDSIAKHRNVSLLLASNDTLNKEAVFKKIDMEIARYIKAHNISMSEHAIERYSQTETLLHHLFDYYVPMEEMTGADFWCYLKVDEMQIEFLNYYLLNECDMVLDNSISKYLFTEKNAIDSLSIAQCDFLRSHLDEAYHDGSMWYCKYFNIITWLEKDYNKSLKDLLVAIYHQFEDTTEYRELSADVFDKEYQHIAYDLIPQKEIYCMDCNILYDESRDRKAILNEKTKWQEFMRLRGEILDLLPKELKPTWENSTYRFQRSHLILLKNEFEGLGITNNDMDSVLLSDSCSYEELFSYSNFSTRWNEYLIENGLQ